MLTDEQLKAAAKVKLQLAVLNGERWAIEATLGMANTTLQIGLKDPVQVEHRYEAIEDIIEEFKKRGLPVPDID